MKSWKLITWITLLTITIIGFNLRAQLSNCTISFSKLHAEILLECENLDLELVTHKPNR